VIAWLRRAASFIHRGFASQRNTAIAWAIIISLVAIIVVQYVKRVWP
jgi:hypothetical protein